jgi:hypothetical protein
LNLDAYSANVTVADHAKADLSGSADNFTLNHGVATSVNQFNFVAAHTNQTKSFVKGFEIADLQ